MWPTLRARINAPVFLVALVCGFAMCCFAGRECAEHHPFQNFRRFHALLSAETYFSPTISQMISLAKEGASQNQKLIIIGGNSIAMGRGQGKELWSEKLQEKLGPAYKVLNFAEPGMPAISGPFIAFLALSEKYKSACYIGFGESLYLSSIENPFVGYPYWWDAYYKHLLPDYSRVEMSINERYERTHSTERESTDELKIGAFLDSLFYFRDLWTTVGYKSFFTVWTRATSESFFKPRKDYPDVDRIPLPLEDRFEGLDLVREHDVATVFFDNLFERDKESGKLHLSEKHLHWFEQSAIDTVPEEVRSRVLMVHVKENAVVLNKALSEEERNCLVQKLHESVKIWKKIGCRALSVGEDYEAKDYLDCVHLSGSGGAKLATTIAKEIEKLTP